MLSDLGLAMWVWIVCFFKINFKKKTSSLHAKKIKSERQIIKKWLVFGMVG